MGFEKIRSEHFIIKYRKGIDEVLARDMPKTLEQIYDDVTTIFVHKPSEPTLIEIMPDEASFGVRVTGMPEIWTIGACTGNVIAIVPPRNGKGQRGTFDWQNVTRHEFVHTVTLSQTNNRLPHWFTEACAVSQERKARDYDVCRLLAKALTDNKLFDLDQIN